MNLAIVGVVLSFMIGVLIGKPLIKMLVKLKYGQKILEIGPKWHMNKQYTPTMGGVIFILPLIITNIYLAHIYLFEGQFEYLSLLLFSLMFGLIGFIDDYTKVAKKQNMGLSALQKLILQILASIIFVTILRNFGIISSEIYIPFVDITLPLNWGVFLVFAVFVVVGTTNAVNLTDGVDGLATCVTIPVTIFFALVSFKAQNMVVFYFAISLLGGLLAFLVFNFNPAKVFMGDTGSLFLGGAVVSMALALNLSLILIPVGIIYITEAVSVILQVAYFKKTGGKRLFKMAPIHHHFEMVGMSEKQICLMFTLLTVLMCIISYKFGVYI